MINLASIFRYIRSNAPCLVFSIPHKDQHSHSCSRPSSSLRSSPPLSPAPPVSRRATQDLESRQSSSLPSGWKMTSACAEDDGKQRVFSPSGAYALQRNVFTEDNSPKKCLSTCAGEGYGYAALRYGTEVRLHTTFIVKPPDTVHSAGAARRSPRSPRVRNLSAIARVPAT